MKRYVATFLFAFLVVISIHQELRIVKLEQHVNLLVKHAIATHDVLINGDK